MTREAAGIYPQQSVTSHDYEQYSETARAYDTTRRPVGQEVILRALATSSQPLQAQTILDGGCGTGHYLTALRPQLGVLHGMDCHWAMLTQARRKLSGTTAVHLVQGDLECLPYRDAMFDGMMCNQVLHHLRQETGTRRWLSLRHLFHEASRVMRAGGVLVVNTSSPQQLRDGFWWADLIPEAVHRVAQYFPTLADLDTLLQTAGFAHTACVPLLEDVLQGRQYLNPYGPFSKTYRDGDSTWSLTTTAQLQRALARLHAMHDTGSIWSYLQQREHLRHQVGQTTCIIARKATAPPARLRAGLRGHQADWAPYHDRETPQP